MSGEYRAIVVGTGDGEPFPIEPMSDPLEGFVPIGWHVAEAEAAE